MDLTERWPRWEKTNCFQKLATGLTIPQLPSLSPADFDVVRRQRIQRQGDVYYGISQDVANHELDGIDSLKAEGDGNLDHWPSWEDDGAMRDALESALSMSSAADIRTEHYIALSPWYRRRRSSLGLSPMALVTNERMRATRDHIKGLHSSAIRLNLQQSFGLCHKEEVDLQLTSLLWTGAPVVWVVISPMHSAKFETQLVDHLHMSPHCSQFVRHHQLIVPPSVLDAWEIDFSIFAQVAGEAVRLNHQTYYYQWHLGANISETINGCEQVWGPPPFYQYCQVGDVRCESPSPITAANMAILVPHPRELRDQPGDSLATSIIAPTTEMATSLSVRSLESGKYSSLFVQQDSASDSSRRGLPSPTENSANGVQDVAQPAPGSNHGSFTNLRRAQQATLRLPASNLDTRKQISPVSSIQESSDEALSGDSDEAIDDFDSDGKDSNPPATPSRVQRAALPPFGPSLSQLEATAAVPLTSAIPAILDSTLQEGNAFGRLTIGSASEGSSAASVDVRSPAMLTPPSTGKSTRNHRIRESISRETHGREIDQYVEFGIQNRDSIAWKYISPQEAGEVLSRFRPQVWLNTSAIMETLSHMVDARPDVYVVNAHSFSTARRTGELESIASHWGLSTIILIPVHLKEKSHWFLVSLDLQRRVVSMHENSIFRSIEDLFVDHLVDRDAWTLKYLKVLANDGHNCGIILLKEAEAILRPDMDIPDDFNLLRQRYVRMVVQDSLFRNLPSRTPNPRIQSSELSPHEDLSDDMILNSPEQETPLSQTELETLASAVGCDKVLGDLQGLFETLRVTPVRGIEQATQLYVDTRDNLTTDAQERAFVAEILKSKKPEIEQALRIYAMKSRSVTADKRGVAQTSTPQSGVKLYSEGESLEILGRFQKSLAAIFLARIFELLVKHYREEKMAQQEAQRRIRNHENYRRRREARGYKVTKRRKDADGFEVVTTGTSSTSIEKISAASMRHAEWKAYDLLAGNCEPTEKDKNRETVKAARNFGSQLLAYEAEAGPGWPLWMFIPTRKIQSPADACYNVTGKK
ncbi:hypothetical protein LTR41_010666 [Exophiala xenobiotica]|nr:hypothetical protein LTR41_010666 [Exophiala xenobiotica]